MVEKVTKIQRIEVPIQDLLDLYLPKYGLTTDKLSSYYYDATKTAFIFELPEVEVPADNIANSGNETPWWNFWS